MVAAHEAARELRARGFVIVREVVDSAVVAEARAVLERVYDRLGRPEISRRGMTDLEDHITRSGSGIQISRLLGEAPELAPRLLPAAVREILRTAMGDRLQIEGYIGKISDATCTMLPWHQHIGGPDEKSIAEDYACSPDAIDRVTVLTYLQRVGPEEGELLIRPRALSEPLEPLGELRGRWDREVAPSLPTGSIAIIDERTWHAATPRTTPGLRMYLGTQIVPARRPMAKNADPTMQHLGSALLGDLWVPADASIDGS